MSVSFNQILVPVDGSVQSMVAFRSAVFFAKKYNSQVTVLHISDDTAPQEAIKGQLATDAENYPFAYQHRKGSVYKEIIHTAKEIEANLIVMGTHGVSGFQEFWMGSNTYKVISTAKCPVLSMREDTRINQFKRIVVPIDTSFESRQKVPAAISLAKQFGATLHVLGVSVDKNKDTDHKILGYLRQVKHSIDEEKVPAKYEKNLGGNITNITIEYAKSVDADLIVIMTEQETQIGSFFLGKFAQQMVNHSSIPILSLMPRDDLFVTEARL
jgi:nucleotide-binding universal stress UspA family protein